VEHGASCRHGQLQAPSRPLYGATFYTMTGFHGAHVTIGVLCMIWVTLGKAYSAATTRRRTTAASRHGAVLAFRRPRLDHPVHHRLPDLTS
jgi:heme/copper-type cytochrome/quinol oxidase subunit 3